MKKIEIIIRREQGQWLARVSKLPDIDWDIQKYGDSKIRTLKSVQSKALRELGNLHENHNLELNGVVFKVTDLSTSNKPFKTLRGKIVTYWKHTLNWMIKTPYLEFFLRIIPKASIFYIAILSSILVGSITSLILIDFKRPIYFLSQNMQTIAIGFAALIGFCGVLLTAAVQRWIATYKTKIDKQNENLKNITDYYEKIIKVLRNPRAFPSEEVLAFIDKFSDKVEVYGSSNISYQWKRLKQKVIIAQFNPLETKTIDWHEFSIFIWAIRKEMGHFGDFRYRYYILEELESIYMKKKSEEPIKNRNTV